MHISEGILSGPVLAAGAVAAAAGTGIGLRKLDYERVPQVAVLSSAFFVAALIHVPIGPASAHLVLNGLCGLILGWASFPALAVALFLQALLFSYGGLTALGVNIATMSVPAVVVHYLFRRAARKAGSPAWAFAAGFGAGAGAIALSCVLLAVALYFSNRSFTGVITAVVGAHIPVIVIEGLVTGSVVVFLRKVKPELLAPPLSEGPTL